MHSTVRQGVLVLSLPVWCNPQLWTASSMLRPYIGIVLGTLLGGCSSTFFFLPDNTGSLDHGQGPVDYQVLVANDLRQLKKSESAGSFEISPLRRTQLTQPGDWFACVRTNVQDRPAHIAVFMRDGRVIDRRQAVVIDGCAQEQFQPLPRVDASAPKIDDASARKHAPAPRAEAPAPRAQAPGPGAPDPAPPAQAPGPGAPEPAPAAQDPTSWVQEPPERIH